MPVERFVLRAPGRQGAWQKPDAFLLALAITGPDRLLARAYGSGRALVDLRENQASTPPSGWRLACRPRGMRASLSRLRRLILGSGSRFARLERAAVLLVVLLAIAVRVANRWPVSHEPGILVAEAPAQVPPASPRLIEHGRYQLTPLADYSIRARVLGAEHYRFDQLADLVPIDLALGWMMMSDSRVLDQMHVFQMTRRFYYFMPGGLISPETAKISAANTHVIPADDDVRAQLYELVEGDVVRLTGQLVAVDGPGGFTMRSSLRRDDSGDGACEVLYVRRVERDPR